MPEANNNEPVKPVTEKFFDMSYKLYCGACDRLMVAGGFNKEKVREQLKKCPWCGRPIKWEE